MSDFRGERDWEGPLRSLRARHGVLAVEIRDPRELELTAMGDLWLVDPETGRQLQVNTSRRSVRRRFAEAAAAEREEVAAALRRTGADHLVLSTHGDWLKDLAGHLRRGEAALRAAAPTRSAARARAPVVDDDPGRSHDVPRAGHARRPDPDPDRGARVRSRCSAGAGARRPGSPTRR